MSHAQDMERRNEHYELQQELGHAEEENRALRASLEDERATVEQMDAKHSALHRAFEQQGEELQRAIVAAKDKDMTNSMVCDMIDAQQDEIARMQEKHALDLSVVVAARDEYKRRLCAATDDALHLQAELIASSARECTCGGEQ